MNDRPVFDELSRYRAGLFQAAHASGFPVAFIRCWVGGQSYAMPIRDAAAWLLFASTADRRSLGSVGELFGIPPPAELLPQTEIPPAFRKAWGEG